MKELCIQIMEENGGIPEGMTIEDGYNEGYVEAKHEIIDHITYKM